MGNLLEMIRNKTTYELQKGRKAWSRYCVRKSGVEIRSIEDTIDFLVNNRISIARFGDGEIDLILGKDIPFQKASPEMAKHLRQVLSKNGHHEDFAVAIPDIVNYDKLFRAKSRQFWEDYLVENVGKWLRLLKRGQPYYNAHVTRLYMDWEDKSNTERWYAKIKKLWESRDVILIEGEKSRLGVGNDLFAGAKSIRRILCPARNAYSVYPEILNCALQMPRDALILIALGPTATVLAYDLFMQGYQAVDVGHIDIEYCWFISGAKEKQIVPGKFTSEIRGGSIVADYQDVQYTEQIIRRIGSKRSEESEHKEAERYYPGVSGKGLASCDRECGAGSDAGRF